MYPVGPAQTVVGYIVREGTIQPAGFFFFSFWLPTPVFLGFPGGSDGKESTCSVGGLALIPGLGRSPARGHGN